MENGDSGFIEYLAHPETPHGTKSPWSPSALVPVTQRLESIKEELKSEANKLGQMLEALGDRYGSFSCEEVEFTLELTAEGGFRLIGTATASAAASISLRFKRHD